MKKYLFAVMVAAALLAFGTPEALAASRSGGWATTATHAEPASGLTVVGPLSGTKPLQVSVALKLHDVSALKADIAKGKILTPAQFEQQFAPSTADVAAVESYLRGTGFRDLTVSANRLLVTAKGTAAGAVRAFNTSLSSFSLHSRSVFANTRGAEVPARLAGIVLSVLGLNDVGRMVPTATNPPSTCTLPGLGYPCSYNPQGFWTAYNANSASTGAGTTIAIFAEGDLTQVVKDLRQEETANGLPQVPVDVVPTGAASSDTSGADEWDLDTQYSTGMAENVQQLIVYDAASLTDADLTKSFDAFASADQAKAASASFGECEYDAYLDGSLPADDEAFAEAASQGQTVFASAGDTGGFCPPEGIGVNGVPAGVPDANYPASSPYVVGVGGTTLITNQPSGTYDQELAWLSGGGGISLFENPPSWQAGDGVTGTLATSLCPKLSVISCGRTVPDIAMDADPNSGANVYVAGTPETVGGTSLASPLALGVWARLESGHGNALPFASPQLYAAGGTSAFHDVILGDTVPYPATPGYDLATGWGTFNVADAENTIK